MLKFKNINFAEMENKIEGVVKENIILLSQRQLCFSLTYTIKDLIVLYFVLVDRQDKDFYPFSLRSVNP